MGDTTPEQHNVGFWRRCARNPNTSGELLELAARSAIEEARNGTFTYVTILAKHANTSEETLTKLVRLCDEYGDRGAEHHIRRQEAWDMGTGLLLHGGTKLRDRTGVRILTVMPQLAGPPYTPQWLSGDGNVLDARWEERTDELEDLVGDLPWPYVNKVTQNSAPNTYGRPGRRGPIDPVVPLVDDIIRNLIEKALKNGANPEIIVELGRGFTGTVHELIQTASAVTS